MTLKQSIAIGLMAALPFAALAQSASVQPDPRDAKAAVPAIAYQSAFADYAPAVGTDDEATPDMRWRAANDKVAQSDGHAGHHASPPKSPAPAAKHTPVDHSKH
ncbi:hypothetical protein HHL21_01805 [Massilia sp. RP-1-19]|uniref:DUF4148 domain-containing protein n=1 Tax=Massilia polaris TaxID=2728846 RepID=A0A848HFI2_9BURK|nr:hypothetical protein [Massilia polaris]NML59837.1 hypothetical protein [Massilia polaris]